MKTRTFRSALLLGMLILVTQFSNAQGLLWEVTSPEGKTSYLFGTYHLVGAEYLSDHIKVAEAFAGANQIVVETVIDSSQLMQAASMGLMMENTLWDFYDTAQFELISSKMQQVTGMSLNGFVQLKPTAVANFYALAIAQQELAASDLSYPGAPLDVYFAHQGSKQSKEVVQLESMMEQMDMLYNSDPLEEQAEALLEMIEDTSVTDMSVRLLEYYRDQDLDAMMALTEEVADQFGDMAILLDNRNNKWIAKLEPVLDQGNAFIAVGALHLPGEEGLIKLLTAEGYKLTPVKGS